jgi:hypothetical protein
VGQQLLTAGFLEAFPTDAPPPYGEVPGVPLQARAAPVAARSTDGTPGFLGGVVLGSLLSGGRGGQEVHIHQGGSSGRDRDDGTTAKVVAGVVGGGALVIGAALLGSGLKERATANQALSNTQEVQEIIQAAKTKEGAPGFLVDIEKVAEGQEEIDVNNAETHNASFWSTIGLIASGALLLIGALFSSPMVLIAGVTGFVAAAALKIYYYCKHKEDAATNKEIMHKFQPNYNAILRAIA